MNYEFLNKCLALEPADTKPVKALEDIQPAYIESTGEQGTIRPEVVKEVVWMQKAQGWYIVVTVEGYIVRKNQKEDRCFLLLPQDQSIFLMQANELSIRTGVSIDDAALFLTRHMV